MTTATTRTKAELRQAVASKLTVLQSGNTVEADDAEIINQGIDNKLRELEDNGLIHFDIDGDSIEVNVFEALVYLIAAPLADDFALDSETMMRINSKVEPALKQLRTIAFQGQASERVRADYF